MDNGNQQTQPKYSEGELQRRNAKTLWRFTVYYTDMDGQRQKPHYLDNVMTRELPGIREGFFTAGVMIPTGPNEWTVFAPQLILQVVITKQSKFFEK